MENWITEEELAYVRDTVLPDPMEDKRITVMVALHSQIELDEALSNVEPDDRPFPVREVQFSKRWLNGLPRWVLKGELVLER